MAQGFAQRLDFVMNVTHTTNSSLARALSFDASYICRIRNGKRGLPRNQPFAEPVAAYLASRITDARQRRAIEDEVGRPWPADEQEAVSLITSWLLASTDGASAVPNAIAALGAPVPNDANANLDTARSTSQPHAAPLSPRVSFHYGNAGKREAVLAFLGQLEEEGKAFELCLHSDENMSWLYEDEDFAQRWSTLLLRIIKNGSQVRIVHTISRDANEMWEAVGKWMPLYMTGAVKPYYYPRLRDGVYRRTLFVARGHSAIVAASVGDVTNNELNMLVSDPQAVAAYEREFSSYLALCRPLMNVIFPRGLQDLIGTVASLAEGKEKALTMLEDGKLVCAWEEGPALVANADSPFVVFGIEERLMSAAVWGYLQSLPSGIVRQNADVRAILDDLAKP